MDGGREVVGRIDAVHLIPAADGNDRRRILLVVLQEPEFEGCLDVAGGEGDSVMPLDAVAELPGHVHFVATYLDVPVFEGRDLGGQLRYPVVGQLRIGGNVLVRLDRQQALHRRIDVGARMWRGGRDVA